MTDRPPRFGLLLFPNITQLDLTGPYEVLARVPGAEMHLLWKDTDPVRSDTGLRILPTTALADCPDLDLLLVPGGSGVQELLADETVLAFLRSQARTVRYLVGVCTGSLVLGAAGLLKGRRAGTHWASRQFLAAFGAVPTDSRVVVDGTLFTGGGVTAGIDVALAIVAELFGEDHAKLIQLSIEYDPQPPFNAGSPVGAGEDLTARLLERMGPMLAARSAAVRAAAARLNAAQD
ncbi:DJ-1/PfpI family protein [Azospirillum doebereinerae]|uniref:DJ-1/PfpI family protein n=1 Tax=Azospirillum doebereinerae TaxID=92933 RepID=A0A433JG11_9PROT|nr:DJ-1/PfpI family protein [Azospirillum doebereinerae]RUQ76091.1 DJ-1/PfpI family protein [Azospirillum doebereinerae]